MSAKIELCFRLSSGLDLGAVCRENQWTGFYMITGSVMKELMYRVKNGDFSEKGQHIIKIYVVNVTKLIFKFTLSHVCFKLNKNKL